MRRECVEVEEEGEGAIRMNLADFHRVWQPGELFIQLWYLAILLYNCH